jgi:hypothetical protein
MATKDDVAKELVQHHFQVEPELRVVYRILGDEEASPGVPIRLLEVNAATVATGSIEVFGFAPSQGVPFPVEIAEITPDELAAFQKTPGALPAGWDLSKAIVFERPKAA